MGSWVKIQMLGLDFQQIRYNIEIDSPSRQANIQRLLGTHKEYLPCERYAQWRPRERNIGKGGSKG